MDIDFYRDSRGIAPVEKYILEQKDFRTQKKLRKFLDKVIYNDDGLKKLYRTKDAKQFNNIDNLSELRPIPHRIFFTIKNDICWLLHIFLKKSKKTPPKHIEIAKKRKDFIHNLT